MKNTEIRVLCVIALLFIIAGCGIEWFPAVTKPATNPNPFSFTTRFGVPISQPYSSASISITGFANSSTASPISISTGSTYSINGGTHTSAGTIKNNDTVKVFQTTTASQPGASSISTLTIGNVSGTFTTVTQTVQTPSFTLTTSGGVHTLLSGLIVGTDVGGHTVSVTGTNVQFAIADANGTRTSNLTSPGTTLNVALLNNQRILLQMPTSTDSAVLTIDSTNFVIGNTSPVTVISAPK
jgi:hypothetical protein